MTAGLRWSLDEDQAILRGISEGKTRKEIARAINRSPDAVCSRIYAMRGAGVDVPRRAGGLSKSHIDTLNQFVKGCYERAT